MATEKQIQANRENAKKSTGPRTEEGKARVSQNALKHGLLARDAILPGEDSAEFESQLAALEADIQPTGALECELVRQIADAQWRLRRLTRLETGYLAAALENRRQIENGFQPKQRQFSYKDDTLLLGSALRRDTQALAHFARYDGHLGRRFERASNKSPACATPVKNAPRPPRTTLAKRPPREQTATVLAPSRPTVAPTNQPAGPPRTLPHRKNTEQTRFRLSPTKSII